MLKYILWHKSHIYISWQSPKQLRLPLPMVTILQGGRVAPGKSNCVKEYMLVPKPGTPLSEVGLFVLYMNVEDTLSWAGGLKLNKSLSLSIILAIIRYPSAKKSQSTNVSPSKKACAALMYSYARSYKVIIQWSYIWKQCMYGKVMYFTMWTCTKTFAYLAYQISTLK